MKKRKVTKKSSKKSAKRKPITKSPEKIKADAKETAARLGPLRKITSQKKLSKTTVLATMECGHKRVVTPRANMRCRKCRVGAKKTVAKKSPVKAVKKSATKKPVAAKKSPVKAATKREPVAEPVAASA